MTCFEKPFIPYTQSLRYLNLSHPAPGEADEPHHALLFLDTRHQILDTRFMTRNSEPFDGAQGGPGTRNSSSNAKIVRLKKPHPCGSNEFTVIRNSVLVTLKGNTCGSFVRMEKNKYEKVLSAKEIRDK